MINVIAGWNSSMDEKTLPYSTLIQYIVNEFKFRTKRIALIIICIYEFIRMIQWRREIIPTLFIPIFLVAHAQSFSIKFSFSLGISNALLASNGRRLIVSLNRYKDVDHYRNIALIYTVIYYIPATPSRRFSIFFV